MSMRLMSMRLIKFTFAATCSLHISILTSFLLLFSPGERTDIMPKAAKKKSQAPNAFCFYMKEYKAQHPHVEWVSTTSIVFDMTFQYKYIFAGPSRIQSWSYMAGKETCTLILFI